MGQIYQSEVDKLQDAQIRSILRKRGKKWIYLIVALLIAVSIVDVRWVKYNNEKDIVQSKFFGLDLQEIKKEVSSGKKILVKIGANWCLTCNYNDYWVLNLDFIKDELINNNVEVIDVDWSNYNEQILNLMKRFGRQGVPVYILFSQKFKEGIVLPEILNKYEFLSLIRM
jgi:thiol:disulfide interchange protein DsbD